MISVHSFQVLINQSITGVGKKKEDAKTKYMKIGVNEKEPFFFNMSNYSTIPCLISLKQNSAF